MVNTILFDLGNTLVRYFYRAEFPEILEEALGEVRGLLRDRGLPVATPSEMWQRVEDEKQESGGRQVRPMAGRLARIFGLDEATQSTDLAMDMCRRFLKPIFARARRYEDTLPTLAELRSKGFVTAIISNTPWGSPAELWREELARQGLLDAVDATVFCTDVGWRKPAPQIFEFTLAKLGAAPEHCIFVGDDPSWDIAGPKAMGMQAILIDRLGMLRDADADRIESLAELWSRL